MVEVFVALMILLAAAFGVLILAFYTLVAITYALSNIPNHRKRTEPPHKK